MPLRSVLVALLVAAPALAIAAPTASDLLTTGRAADARGDHAAAATALEAALALAPDDAEVLAELGWVYFEAKDLARAEAATRWALALRPISAELFFPGDRTNALHGAAAYNLGQILEARGETAGAVAAYADSLKARPNATVAKRLRALDPAAADAADPLAPSAMDGPFPSVAAYCQKVAEPGTSVGGQDADCWCGQPLKNEGGKRLPAGIAEIAVFPRHGCADHTDQELDIAVKHGDAWFVTGFGTGAVNDGHDHCGAAEFRFTGTSVQSGVIAQVEYRSLGSCFHLANEWGWDNRIAVAIGIGPSGKPATTPEIAVKLVDDDGGHRNGKTTVAHALAWGKDGALAITGTVAARALELGGDLRGPHRLVFP